MREIVGQMRLEEMVTDRKAFGERVQENAIPDLEKMGLEMISFNVQSFFRPKQRHQRPWYRQHLSNQKRRSRCKSAGRPGYCHRAGTGGQGSKRRQSAVRNGNCRKANLFGDSPRQSRRCVSLPFCRISALPQFPFPFSYCIAACFPILRRLFSML